MLKYGVCYCDVENSEPKITDLIEFDTYEQACDYYYENVPRKNISLQMNYWVVFITDNKVIQFEQLTHFTRGKIISI